MRQSLDISFPPYPHIAQPDAPVRRPPSRSLSPLLPELSWSREAIKTDSSRRVMVRCKARQARRSRPLGASSLLMPPWGRDAERLQGGEGSGTRSERSLLTTLVHTADACRPARWPRRKTCSGFPCSPAQRPHSGSLARSLTHSHPIPATAG